ncbi:hypothetical protein [Candidatus Methylomirabilis sp.]|uniref:Uncharacterized protein n=1 Tax=Candidatus Methylomirabilis tolerans TaxID=3123416 RepID=A0AAJ1AJ42_9BACT|nr:hypothetical protein [Candidatus Methylomirabilis sp.]
MQSQFKQKAPKTYRYDPSLDPALSWDVSVDRERAEALIARIERSSHLAVRPDTQPLPWSVTTKSGPLLRTVGVLTLIG